jgi:hypothetical protein
VNDLNFGQLVAEITEAAQECRRATFFELAVECYQLLSVIHKTTNHYEELPKVLKAEQELVEMMTSEHVPPTRLIPVYFRVAFFGKVCFF